MDEAHTKFKMSVQKKMKEVRVTFKSMVNVVAYDYTQPDDKLKVNERGSRGTLWNDARGEGDSEEEAQTRAYP